jgi:lipoate---protein ligase
MKCILSPFTDCYHNIGSEEYFLSEFNDAVFYLYINDPCIVVGRHQNTYAEINSEYVKAHGIDVVRRMSGGGAVYHDTGNLNYGFIAKNEGQGIDSIFREYTLPIIKALKTLGVKASFSGRNDLMIDEKKVSGTAQYHYKDKILIHGTLLFSSDLSRVAESLNVDPRKFQDKGIKSVRSRVSNIAPFLPRTLSIESFSFNILREILAQEPAAEMYELTDADKTAIDKLAAEKYSTWEWVYGSSPTFSYQHALKYDGGLADLGLQITSGRVEDIRIYGDFFGEKDIEELYMLLRGLPYEEAAVADALKNIDVGKYMHGMESGRLTAELFRSH